MGKLVIEGVIGPYWADISSSDVRGKLENEKGDVDVHLNSVGGDVFEGLAIFNQLRRHDGKITMYVDGLAASIASVVLMAGDEILMGTGAQVMVHSPWTITVGDQDEHERATKALETAKGSLLDAYATRVEDREQMATWVDDETWFGAQEAVDAGLADRIEGEAVAGAIVPKSLYKHTPAALISQNDNGLGARVWQSVLMGMRTEIERRRA